MGLRCHGHDDGVRRRCTTSRRSFAHRGVSGWYTAQRAHQGRFARSSCRSRETVARRDVISQNMRGLLWGLLGVVSFSLTLPATREAVPSLGIGRDMLLYAAAV